MNIAHILNSAQRPSRYTGTEHNARRKNWHEAQVRFCLCFPDLYEVGMSHLGLHILYHILNELPVALADRVYAPEPDVEQLMRQTHTPIWAVESKQPLQKFDAIGITLPYELCYTNILTVLSLASIPFYSKDRLQKPFPLIIGGGSASVQPEPVADFFDAILIGDGEEAVVEIVNCIKKFKDNGAGCDKTDLLEMLSAIDGVYVPSFYAPYYRVKSIKAYSISKSDPNSQNKRDLTVKKRIISELDQAPFPIKPLVPHVKIVHDRFGVEIGRGCSRGCRFCQAGMIYRPVRERSFKTITGICEAGLMTSGWEEMSLLSLSAGDYSSIEGLIATLMDRQDHVSVSLPSLRAGTLSLEMVERIKEARKTGFTIAPEAGSERMRGVINKGITEENIFDTAKIVYENGWKGLKLYFMIGLPTETDEDVLAIAELARRLVRLGKSINKSITVTVSVGTFVPKAHTPFQWEGQISTEEARRRLDLIKNNLKDRSINFKWHNPMMSLLEGVFSRGDRQLSSLIELAWQKGARLDGWSDHLRVAYYEEAANELGLDLKAFLEPIPTDAELSWQHISTGVTTDFLLSERQKAYQAAQNASFSQEFYTPDCRYGRCQGCGVCDFKEVKNRVFEPVLPDSAPKSSTRSAPSKANLPELSRRHRYLLHYSKLGDARFIGHLDMAHLFHRACRRANLPLLYSHGFHPMPYLSFGSPLAVAMEGVTQKLGMELELPINPEEILLRLNKELPVGIKLSSCQKLSGDAKISFQDNWDYVFAISGQDCATLHQCVESFNLKEENGNQASWLVELEKKGRPVLFDLKKQVKCLDIFDTNSKTAMGELASLIAEWITDLQNTCPANKLCLFYMQPDLDVKPSAKATGMIKTIFSLDKLTAQNLRIVRRDFDL